jgi:hypothetical protein
MEKQDSEIADDLFMLKLKGAIGYGLASVLRDGSNRCTAAKSR